MRLIDGDELLKAMDTWDKFGVDANTKVVPVKDCYVPYVHYDDMIKAVKGMPTVELKRVKPELKAKMRMSMKDKILKRLGLVRISTVKKMLIECKKNHMPQGDEYSTKEFYFEYGANSVINYLGHELEIYIISSRGEV